MKTLNQGLGGDNGMDDNWYITMDTAILRVYLVSNTGVTLTLCSNNRVTSLVSLGLLSLTHFQWLP